MAANDRPTARQQSYLRALAQNTGTSFIPPKTKAEASAEIKRLKALNRSPKQERDADRNAVQRADRGGATRVRDAEITGYGSNAHWRGVNLDVGEDY